MSSSNYKRIVKNTLMLYFRMLLTMGVSLYTVRVVLNVLGVEDYGIYNVVGGIVSLLVFLPGTMASATQRYFSFALGENNREKLEKTFTVNWILYGAIAGIALLVFLTIGLWFVNEQLKVPPERFEAARVLYFLSVLTFAVSLFTSPFMAILIAHEDMHIYAYVSIGEALLRLGAVFLLAYLPWDKLELYGLLVLIVTALNAAVYIGICMWKYEECQFRQFHWDKLLLKEIVGFTTWTLFGQLSTAVRTQAVTILLNQMFNPAVVAARAVATNVSVKVVTFSGNFNRGLYPPIIKAYAANDKGEMFSLIFNGSKITFYLMWLLALPLFLEMDVILTLWLKEPPADAVLFTRLALIEGIIMSVSLPLATAARAPGKMKLYELVLGTIQLAIFPASWLVLKMGCAAYSVFVVAIVANLIMFYVRLVLVHYLIQIPVWGFLREVMTPIFKVGVASLLLAMAADRLFPDGLMFSVVSIAWTGLASAACIYFIGLNKEWRAKVPAMIKAKLSKKAAK